MVKTGDPGPAPPAPPEEQNTGFTCGWSQLRCVCYLRFFFPRLSYRSTSPSLCTGVWRPHAGASSP